MCTSPSPLPSPADNVHTCTSDTCGTRINARDLLECLRLRVITSAAGVVEGPMVGGGCSICASSRYTSRTRAKYLVRTLTFNSLKLRGIVAQIESLGVLCGRPCYDVQ